MRYEKLYKEYTAVPHTQGHRIGSLEHVVIRFTN